MAKRLVLAALLGLFLAPLATQAQDAPATGTAAEEESLPAKFRRLAAELDDADYKVRDAATEALKKLGRDALALAESRLEDEELSLEARWRLEEVVRSFAGDSVAEAPETPEADGSRVVSSKQTEARFPSQIRIRLAAGSESRAVEVTENGARVTVKRDGAVYAFEQGSEGGISVRITAADGAVEEKRFADAEAMKTEAPDLFELYDGDGFSLRIFAQPEEAAEKVEAPQLPDNADLGEAMDKMRRAIEELDRRGELAPDDEELLEQAETLREEEQKRFFETAEDGATSENGGKVRASALVGDLDRLSEDETAMLTEKALRKLDRDLEKLAERAEENRKERDPDERRETEIEIERDSYLVCLKAFERSLADRIGALRKYDDRYEDNLDDLEDKIRDTFADLRDKIEDEDRVTWADTFAKGRKFFASYNAEVDDWSEEIAGEGEEVINPAWEIKELERDLLNRIRDLRYGANDDERDSLDDLAGKIKDTFADLQDQVEDESPKAWDDTLEDARAFHENYSADLDAWERRLKTRGEIEPEVTALERLKIMASDLLIRLHGLRDTADDLYEDNLDDLEEKIKDTFADLADKMKDEAPEKRADLLEVAGKYYNQFDDQLRAWAKKIRGDNDFPNREVDPEDGKDPENPEGFDELDSPERDMPLARGSKADIVAGVRVARLMPLVKRQLGLDNGLEVKEIVDPDGLLAVTGLEVYDIVLEIDGTPVDTRTGLRELVDALEAGKEFKLTVLRDGEKRELKGER